jgi:SH3-like domain-containing protein
MSDLRRSGALFGRLKGGRALNPGRREGITARKTCAWLGAIGLAALSVVIAATAPAVAGDGGAGAAGAALPRFMSLRSDRVNLRVGPGRTYPILWVLTRKGMPVEILRNYEDWRMIRDPDGDKGWVQRSMVAEERTVVVTGAIRALHTGPEAASGILARAEPGVIARLLLCRDAWCRISASGYTGWVKRTELWGVDPAEGGR